MPKMLPALPVLVEMPYAMKNTVAQSLKKASRLIALFGADRVNRDKCIGMWCQVCCITCPTAFDIALLARSKTWIVPVSQGPVRGISGSYPDR